MLYLKTIRKHLPMISAVLAPLVLLLVGWAIIAVRSDSGSLTGAKPNSSASSTAQSGHWMVGQATKTLVVHSAPDENSAVKWRLPVKNVNDYPQIVQVNEVRTVGDVTWYNAYVAVPPKQGGTNPSTGWIREGSLALYRVVTRLDVDLSARTLSVYVGGELKGSFPIGIGENRYPTPTGRYFINQKFEPANTSGAYGVLALGISAFQTELPSWPQGGPVAIHGTSQPELVGQAITRGCLRMTNEAIIAVNDLAPTGSPVFIHE